jgi:autotransporter-associated beta strand protein
LPTSTVVTIADSGTLDLHGVDQTLAGLTDTGSGARIVTNSAATGATLNVAGTSSFGGVIQNGASPTALATSGSGTVFTVTGANTYTGGTTIGAGSTLAIGNGGATGAIAGDVTNNGTLAFNRSDDLAFGGSISGSGKIVKQGAGTLAFNGSHAGATEIQAGTLDLHGTLTGDVAVSNGANFDVSHLLEGTYQIAANRILENQGTVGGNVTVDGALTGTGAVTGTVTANNGGSIAPGVGGIGTLTAAGALTLGAGSSLNIELGGTPLNLSDLIVASGISLSGSGTGVTLNLSLLPGASMEGNGSVFFIANNTGAAAVSGFFANATTTGSFGAAFNGETFTLLNSPVGGDSSQFAISYDANFANGSFHGGNDIALMAVPEPTTPMTLLAGAAALLGLQRFRRNRRAVA